MLCRLLWTIVLFLAWLAQAAARLVAVPTIPFSAIGGTLPLSHINTIIVDARHADAVDHTGQTLIPPSLRQFAATFQDDLRSALGLHLPLELRSTPAPNSIFLTVTNNTGFHDVARRHTPEAYALEIRPDGVTIAGASPLGAWWGSRSLIQAAVLGDKALPLGSGVDAPGWASRGIMLDAGRHYYPPEFLVEMCAYLSFFKQNVFHLHLSDNLFNNVERYSTEVSMNLYAAFRLWSDDSAVAGLNRRPNESYTRAQFDNIQQQCARRGVTIIPEIEAPGHALSIVQWRPEIGLRSDLSMLNISHPNTIPIMKTIWKTFLPWFHTKTVHIGADEYEKKLIPDYTRFVNEMQKFIAAESGKRVRIWGTFTPSQGANVTQEVSIQHWELYEDNPYFDYIRNGYEVLNSDDAFYIVGKWSDTYPASLNKTRVFHGNPADGGAYAPNIFDTKNAANNPPRDNPLVLGHIAALWNDFGPNSTSVLEAYYSWRNALPALADKQWGGGLLEKEYDRIFDKLHAAIPGQNLDRRIPTSRRDSDTILHYRFESDSNSKSSSGILVIRDLSGNGFDGKAHGCQVQGSVIIFDGKCYLETPLHSKGRDYTLSFSIKPTTSSTAGTLFTGSDSSLLNGNRLAFSTGGNAYALNYTLPVHTWTDVHVVGQGNCTFLDAGSQRMEFLARLGINGEHVVWAPIAIEAPLARVGEGFEGMMKEIVLKGSASRR